MKFLRILESIALVFQQTYPHSICGCVCVAGILQEAMGRGEYWRLVDGQGRPPGLMGMWPSRAVTFIENHDTGCLLTTHHVKQSLVNDWSRHLCPDLLLLASILARA